MVNKTSFKRKFVGGFIFLFFWKRKLHLLRSVDAITPFLKVDLYFWQFSSTFFIGCWVLGGKFGAQRAKYFSLQNKPNGVGNKCCWKVNKDFPKKKCRIKENMAKIDKKYIQLHKYSRKSGDWEFGKTIVGGKTKTLQQSVLSFP